MGEKSWKTGAAALDENSKRYFKRTFDSDNLKADAINFFATIHYMMDTEKDLQGLMSNINRHLKKNGKVVIICLNGEKVHELLKKNNGVYSIKDKEKEILYEVTSKYDHKKKPQQYGSKIEIFFKGVYGLGKGITENIVSTKDLVKLFKSNGFRELLVTEYKNISKEIYKSLLPFEKKIMDIYKLIVLEKNS